MALRPRPFERGGPFRGYNIAPQRASVKAVHQDGDRFGGDGARVHLFVLHVPPCDAMPHHQCQVGPVRWLARPASAALGDHDDAAFWRRKAHPITTDHTILLHMRRKKFAFYVPLLNGSDSTPTDEAPRNRRRCPTSRPGDVTPSRETAAKMVFLRRFYHSTKTTLGAATAAVRESSARA